MSPQEAVPPCFAPPDGGKLQRDRDRNRAGFILRYEPVVAGRGLPGRLPGRNQNMNDNNSTSQPSSMRTILWAVVGLIGFAALMRLAPHPWNFTPVAAMALFGGAVLRRPLFAFGVPLAALAISDMFLNIGYVGNALAPPNPWVYGSFLLIGIMGYMVGAGRGVGFLAGASLTGSVLFFGLTNLGTWAAGILYPRTMEGLAVCFTAALPFFANTVMGDLFWNAVLFGGFYAVSRATGTSFATGRA